MFNIWGKHYRGFIVFAARSMVASAGWLPCEDMECSINVARTKSAKYRLSPSNENTTGLPKTKSNIKEIIYERMSRRNLNKISHQLPCNEEKDDRKENRKQFKVVFLLKRVGNWQMHQ